MKQFLRWCVVFFGLYGVLSSAYHLHLMRHLQPYAPRALAQMLDQHRYPEMAVADQIYVVTNAANSAALAEDKRWHIVQLQPVAP